MKIITMLVLVVGLTACTPEQLASFEQHTGIELSASEEAFALAQPDVPLRLQDGTVIETDGTVVAPVGLSAALLQAVAGDCESWRAVYDWFAANAQRPPTWSWFRKVLHRESRCGLDTYNERTGDSGPMQVNPVHRGWLMREFGISFDQVRHWHAGMLAALALYDKTGRCNWAPPNFCR